MSYENILNDLLGQINLDSCRDEKKELLSVLVAAAIIKKLQLCRVENTVYWYTGTHYLIVNSTLIKRAIIRLLIFEKKVFIEEVFYKLDGLIVGREFDDRKNCLSVKNGLIDLDDVVKYQTVVLLPHTDQVFCTYYLDVEYKKSSDLSYAGAVSLSDFMASFTYDSFNADQEDCCNKELDELGEKIKKGELTEREVSLYDTMLYLTYSMHKNLSVEMYHTLFEMVAYFLYPKNFLKKMFFIIGNKHNGKSTFFYFLENFFGTENCSFLDFAMLGKQFGCSQLENTWVNFGDDISNFKLVETSIFKKLASGDVLNVERKYQENITITHSIKCLFSANVLPEIKLDGAGLDRLFLLPFDNTFAVSQNRNINILEEVCNTQVFEVLLNWALEKLPGIVRSGKMTYQNYSRFTQKLNEYQESNSILVHWIMENSKNDDEKFEDCMARFLHHKPIGAAYDDFKEYCFKAGEKDIPIPLRNFVRELQALNVPCKKIRKMINGDRSVMLEFPNMPTNLESGEKIIYLTPQKQDDFVDYVEDFFEK